MSESSWRNRICGYGEESPEQLLAHEKNFRIHPQTQQDALSGVLEDVGIVQNVIVSRRSQKVLDGHLRVALAISKGQPTIPVTYVDLDEDEESLILATFDPISALAVSDEAKLRELIADAETANQSAAVDAMLSSLLDASTQAMIKPVEEQKEESADDERSGAFTIGTRGVTVKAVLFVDDVSLFEQAIAMTGHRSRGDALKAICQRYVEVMSGRETSPEEPAESDEESTALFANFPTYTE